MIQHKRKSALLSVAGGWLLLLTIVLGGWFRATPVLAASGPQLVIDKRVSVPSTSNTQQTAPLAGAHYWVTRIVASGQGAIDPSDAKTYRAATGLATFSAELVTDNAGRATAALVVGASYLVVEQASTVIKHPAAPVAFTVQRSDQVITVAPKSNLDFSGPKKPAKTLGNTLTTAGTPVGKKIAHTGGAMHVQAPVLLLAVLLLASGSYLLIISRLARARRG